MSVHHYYSSDFLPEFCNGIYRSHQIRTRTQVLCVCMKQEQYKYHKTKLLWQGMLGYVLCLSTLTPLQTFYPYLSMVCPKTTKRLFYTHNISWKLYAVEQWVLFICRNFRFWQGQKMLRAILSASLITRQHSRKSQKGCLHSTKSIRIISANTRSCVFYLFLSHQ